jgi:hypothetical protein
MRIRGMRDIPTQFGLAKRSKPNSRDEAITEMARLEHEKARLEREMALWLENQKRTQTRLDGVKSRLAILQGIVEESAGQPRTQAADAAGQPDGGSERWTTVRIEY